MRLSALTAALLSGVCVCAIPVYAEDVVDIERLAAVDPGTENAVVDRDSVRGFATVTVFVVKVAPKSERRNPDFPARREIRYLANCSARKMALASVSLIDAGGEVAEIHTAAPESMRYRVPDDDSAQKHWLDAACSAL